MTLKFLNTVKTGLLDAIKTGLYEKVQEALDNGADPNAIDMFNSGLSALHLAAQYGNQFIVELLLTRGAKIDTTAMELKLTPLHIAALYNKSEIIKILVDHGANKESTSTNGLTPLGMALTNKNNFDATLMLLHAEAKVLLPQYQKNLMNMLKEAARVDNKDFLFNFPRQLLDKILASSKNSYLEGVDGIGIIPKLALANLATTTYETIGKYRDWLILWPYSKAVTEEEENIFHALTRELPSLQIISAPQLFLEEIIQTKSIKTRENLTKTRENLTRKIDKLLKTADERVEYWSAEYSHERKCFYIKIIHCGACRLNFDHNGKLVDFETKLGKLKAIIKLLQEHGNNINAVNRNHETPLSYLLKCPPQIVEAFIHAGAKARACDLQTAIKESDPKVIALLAQNCQDINTKNAKGETALDMLRAEAKNNILDSKYELMKLFIEYGAKYANELTVNQKLPIQELSIKIQELSIKKRPF